MAILNLDYYTQKDYYSDGDIENRMLEMVKEGISYEDLPEGQVEFPMIYHFSDLRTNILCWYPIKKTESVLEIGAGCGAITGMLCEKAGYVTSVELSKRRSDINFERNKDKENLTIMVGNLNDMKLQNDYDYVVVNGVLEYAMGFTEGDTPYETFLRKMGNYLKPEGKILVAIENKLGLKYFAGAPEDHTDLQFFGINRYPGNHTVRTFSKAELTELMEQSGFPFMKFYYPYPDYKFPTEIFTDDTLYKNSYGKEYPIYTEKTVDLFSEAAGVKNFSKEKILDRFANSFLVVAGKKELQEEENILYVKLNQDRKKPFRLMTSIIEKNDVVSVEKRAMNPEAVPFVKSLKEIGDQKLQGKYENLSCVYEDGAISYPFLRGTTLNERIRELVEEERLDLVEAALWEFYDTYFERKKKVEQYQSESFCEVFGEYPGKTHYECIQPANVDLICDNIFAEKDGSKIIDYEWVFPFAVPVLFIMWRMIHELYTKIPRLVRLCPEETMMEKFGISYSDYEIFRQWTLHFVYEYVGSDSLDVYRKKRISVDFTRIVEKELDKNRMYTKLYYDLGKGLNETNTIRQSIQLERDRFEVTFDFSAIEGMRGMRWNPVQGRMCRVQIENVECECKAEFVPWGAHVQNNGQTTTFLNTDPAYYINVWEPENLKSIKIQGRIHFLELNDVEQMITTIQAQLQNQNAEDGIKHPEKQEVVADGRGKIAAVKKLVKQMIGKEPREEVHGMRNSCMGSVDQFHYEKNTLSLAGWAFDNKYPMKRARIAFYANGKKIQEYPFIVIFRKDVAAALGNPAAEGCGFIFSASVQTAKSLNVFLEYDIEVGTGQFHLGTIPAEAGRGSEDEIWIFPIEDPKSLGNLRFFMKHHLMAKPLVYPESLAKQTIDVIIPVYNGLEYFDKLFAGIEKTRLSYRLIIVDDKSPDPRVKEYLDRYAAAHENVILLRNEQNMGFLPSVNRALAMAENHVALVNTDVEVPEEWLERLMLPIITKEKVATSTPFTTCGTICSFPRFCEDNPIFEEMQLWQIDEVFRKVKPQYPVMPTGIGFCMGMNIHAIRKVGLLDAKTFGKGYGEENDWCQRAIKAGYQNVQADNLFVYHKHGGSFSSEEKRRLLEHNLAELSRKHPNYNRDTAEYCRRDPSRTIRQYAVLKLLNKKLDVPTIVAFDHNLGGGATEYLIEKRRIALSEGYRFITIRYDNPGTKYYLNYEYKSYEIECFSNELETLLEQIQRVDEIWINELVTYQNFYQTLSRIVELKREHKAHLKMLLHDFFFVCPAINLMNAEGKYCGAAEAEVCNQCIPCNKSNACLEYESGSVWRERWKNFLLECDAIIAFSDDTARLFKKVYPDVYHLHVIPHKPHYLPALDKKVKTTNTLNIGLLGVLCYKKGLDVVKQMVSYIEQNQLNIRIKLIGVTDEEIDSPVFSCTGRYTRDQLPRLTMQEDIDVFLIPSIWPETFSYTTSEIMSMNMPVAVFPIGAPVERVQHYAKGLVISKADTETIISEITDFIEHTLQYSQMMIQNKKILFVGEEISFASRYRVEHFREQLIYHGYASEFIQIDEREQIDMSKYAALVFYRCSNRAGVEKLVKLARKLEMAVYYDIDDFIFRYDEISHLHFLTGSEYADFREKTEQIHACMELCDGYFTSTNTLAEQIQKEFPEKPVVINRNCASVEMQVLSHEALEQTDKDPDKICIGYFSGSRTHDQDFEVAEKALKYVLEKYPQVHIKLVGVLSESKLKGMESRTEKLPFMAWQQLPAAIAGIDINLMPLEDSLFQCCKSENKWMEAALVKVPSVMSRNREMELVIENGKTAWLCQTEEEWIQALENLITDEKARRAMGENAYQVVMEHYVTSNTGKDAREELLCSRGFSK